MPDLPGSVESPTEGAGKVSYPSPSAASTRSEDGGFFHGMPRCPIGCYQALGGNL